MMILTDFYIALALVVISAAGGLIVWYLAVRPADPKLLKMAAVLLMGSGLIGGVALTFYGKQLTSSGCLYSEMPLVPQASQSTAPPAERDQEHAP